MSVLARLPRASFVRIAGGGVVIVVLLMVADAAAASPDSGRAPLRRLNPHPGSAYEIRVTLADAPGRFESLLATAQFDVENPGECGRVDPLSGSVARISSNEPIVLTRRSEAEYSGVFHLDQILDEDYYGRAVCRWSLAEVGVVLRASGDAADTRFIIGLPAHRLRSAGQARRYFWSGCCPRARMEGFADLGTASLEEAPEDRHNAFFSITLRAASVAP